jgi:hypothetical protein
MTPRLARGIVYSSSLERFAQGNEKEEMNWPLFISLIELEVTILAFAGVVIWTVRFFRKGVWR